MAIFEIKGEQLKRVRPTAFAREKQLQTLVEHNLETIFNCQLIASEFSTGDIHAGRIDTLALSEDFNPVIIEYKRTSAPNLINQSLYYLDWLKDHRGDFQVAVTRELGKHIEVDWSDIRVICLAPEYGKFDLHAARAIDNIELWQYKLYENQVLLIEEVYRRARVNANFDSPSLQKGKNPVMVEAGKKAAITRQTGSYTIESHLEYLNPRLRELFNELRDYIVTLDSSIEEIPKKHYIAYKTSQNFVCAQLNRNKILLFLKIRPEDIAAMPANARDVRNIGHSGTGDLEVSIERREDLESTRYLIEEAFKNIGG